MRSECRAPIPAPVGWNADERTHRQLQAPPHCPGSPFHGQVSAHMLERVRVVLDGDLCREPVPQRWQGHERLPVLPYDRHHLLVGWQARRLRKGYRGHGWCVTLSSLAALLADRVAPPSSRQCRTATFSLSSHSSALILRLHHTDRERPEGWGRQAQGGRHHRQVGYVLVSPHRPPHLTRRLPAGEIPIEPEFDSEGKEIPLREEL